MLKTDYKFLSTEQNGTRINISLANDLLKSFLARYQVFEGFFLVVFCLIDLQSVYWLHLRNLKCFPCLMIIYIKINNGHQQFPNLSQTSHDKKNVAQPY